MRTTRGSESNACFIVAQKTKQKQASKRWNHREIKSLKIWVWSRWQRWQWVRSWPQDERGELKTRSHTQELIYLEVTGTSEQLLQLLRVEGSKWKEEGEPSSTLRRKISHLAASLRQLVHGLARASLVPMASDASHMLEAALEQMDDIITGKSFWFIIVLSRLPTLRLWGLKGNRFWWMRKHVIKKRARKRKCCRCLIFFVFFLICLLSGLFFAKFLYRHSAHFKQSQSSRSNSKQRCHILVSALWHRLNEAREQVL